MTSPVLKLDGIETFYGAIQALHGVSLSVQPESIVAVLGANGAGKSTTLRTVVGVTSNRSGSVEFLGERIDRWSAAQRIRAGMAIVPESREVFPELTVEENLRMGAFVRHERNLSSDYERVYHLFPRLEERRRQRAGTLSGGEQQMVAVGRALMARPRLILLDEPSLGLAPKLVDEVYQLIVRLRSEEKLTILLVEQNAHMALSVADYGYVLETGKVSLEGGARELSSDARMAELYLGQ